MTPDRTPFRTQRLFSAEERRKACACVPPARSPGGYPVLAEPPLLSRSLSRRPCTTPARGSKQRAAGACLRPPPAPTSPAQPSRAEPGGAARRRGAVQHCGQRQPPAEPSPAQPSPTGRARGRPAGAAPPRERSLQAAGAQVPSLPGAVRGRGSPRLSAATGSSRSGLGGKRSGSFFLRAFVTALPLLKR